LTPGFLLELAELLLVATLVFEDLILGQFNLVGQFEFLPFCFLHLLAQVVRLILFLNNQLLEEMYLVDILFLYQRVFTDLLL
jgi:hypothetical protein